MQKLLQEELQYRSSIGHNPMTVKAISRKLNQIGYRLDRSRDCRGFARYLSGERAGDSYPCITTGIVEIETGMSFAHFEARRDDNFRKLQEIRLSGELFAVVRGHILDL